MSRVCVLVAGLTAWSCSESDAPTGAAFQPGLQYNGSVAFARAEQTGAQALSAAGALVGHFEISAPVIPDVLVLYAEEGAQFPASLPDEDSLADAAALDFSALLVECAGYPDYAGIVITGPSDPPLTQAQLTLNYELVAECSYVHHTAKPYWIPRLVADVDVCGRTLGADWRLLADSDVASFSTADFQILADVLAGASTGGSFGALYFSLHTYVRDSSGGLAQAHLEPNAAVRVEPLPVPATSTSHLEGDFGLRCIRSVP